MYLVDYTLHFHAIPSPVPKHDIGHHGRKQFQTYESNCAYVLRFMIDRDIVGGGWVTAQKGMYRVRTGSKLKSHCQLEVGTLNCVS